MEGCLFECKIIEKAWGKPTGGFKLTKLIGIKSVKFGVVDHLKIHPVLHMSQTMVFVEQLGDIWRPVLENTAQFGLLKLVNTLCEIYWQTGGGKVTSFLRY